jgi:ABC-type polysaccharide/polyol phosphate export permease
MITFLFKLWNSEAIFEYKIWHLLAMSEIKQKFKRSMLGTLWHSLGTGIAILGIGPLYATIFNVEVGEYFVFISISLILWNYVQGTINEACGVFQGHESYHKDLQISNTVFIYKIVWKNTVIFSQNLIMLIVIFLFLGELNRYHPHYIVLIIPLLFFMLCNIAMLVGLIATRYRDVAQIVQSGMQVLFFITPILWKPGRTMEGALVIDLNPLYYIINVPRQLALGNMPRMRDYFILLCILFFTFILSEFFYRKYYKRLVFWL